MKKNRLITIILPLILIAGMLFMLAGCGSSAGGDEANTDNTGDPADTSCKQCPEDLIGTWDLSIDDEGNQVPSGTVILELKAASYEVTEPDCTETGTYTADTTSLSVTPTSATGSDCDVDIGEVDTIQYTISEPSLIISGGGDTTTWVRSTGKSTANSNVTGIWSGTWVDTVFGVSGSLDITITQKDNDLTATGNAGLGSAGLADEAITGSGTINGATASFTFTGGQTSTGLGTVNGTTINMEADVFFGHVVFTGTVNGNNIDGTFNFTNPGGGAGTVTLTKQ